MISLSIFAFSCEHNDSFWLFGSPSDARDARYGEAVSIMLRILAPDRQLRESKGAQTSNSAQPSSFAV